MQLDRLTKLKEEFSRLKSKVDQEKKELAVLQGENRMLTQILGSSKGSVHLGRANEILAGFDEAWLEELRTYGGSPKDLQTVY